MLGKSEKTPHTKKTNLGLHTLLIIIIVLSGFLIRFSFITSDKYTQIKHFPKGIGSGNSSLLGWDGVRYDWIAKNVIDSKGYGYKPNKPDAWRPPGYPFFLIFVYKLFGKKYFVVRLFQAILSSLTILMIYLITLKISNKVSALSAALICSFYYEGVIFPLLFYSETLFAFCVSCVLYLLYNFSRFDDKPKLFRWGYIIFTGVIIGYTIMIRPILMPILPFLAFGIFLRNGFNKKNILKLVYIFLSAMIVLAPWCIRNSVLYKKPMFISNNGGLNFSMGFCANANGHFLKESKRFTKEEQQIIKDKGVGAVGMNYIKTYPLKSVQLFFKKIYIQLFFPDRNGTIIMLGNSKIPLFTYTPQIAILFMAGLLISIFYKNRDFYIIYSYLVGYLLSGSLFFYMGDRHRIPLIVVYCVFGGFFIDKTWIALSALLKYNRTKS